MIPRSFTAGNDEAEGRSAENRSAVLSASVGETDRWNSLP